MDKRPKDDAIREMAEKMVLLGKKVVQFLQNIFIRGSDFLEKEETKTKVFQLIKKSTEKIDTIKKNSLKIDKKKEDVRLPKIVFILVLVIFSLAFLSDLFGLYFLFPLCLVLSCFVCLIVLAWSLSRMAKMSKAKSDFKTQKMTIKQEENALVILEDCSIIEGLNVPTQSKCEIKLTYESLIITTNGVEYILNRQKIIGSSVVCQNELTGAIGANYGGAILGGLLFGGIGAIVGGMSKSQREDNVYLLLNYYDKNDKIQVLCIKMPTTAIPASVSGKNLSETDILEAIKKPKSIYITQEIDLLKTYLCNNQNLKAKIEL